MFFCIFLSFCYMFLSVFSVFFDFVVSPSQFPTHFAIFRVAVSQISRVSSTLRLFLSILLSCFTIFNFEILLSFFSIGYILLSFWQALCRFNAFMVRDDKQAGKPDSQCPPGKIISALRFAQLFPRWFTNVYFIPAYVHFMFHD